MPKRGLFGETELRRIGRHVRAAREQAGQTQGRLAEAAGVSERAVRDIETGRANPSLATISGIVAALGMTLDEPVAEARRQPPSPDFTPAAAVVGPRTPLTRGLRQPRMVARIVDLSGDEPRAEGPMFGLVLRGAISVALDGDETSLRAGDSLHAQPGAIQRWRGRSPDALMLVVEVANQRRRADPLPQALSKRDKA